MPQIRTITPFMAAIPGIDHCILHDVGLDAEGNLVDKDDPRIRRRTIGRPSAGQLLKLMGIFGTGIIASREPLLKP